MINAAETGRPSFISITRPKRRALYQRLFGLPNDKDKRNDGWPKREGIEKTGNITVEGFTRPLTFESGELRIQGRS